MARTALLFAALAACSHGGAERVQLRARMHVTGGHAEPKRRETAAVRAALESIRASLEEAARERVAQAPLPSVLLGVVDATGLVWWVGHGKHALDGGADVDAHSVYRIGSITKTVTAAALLTLRDRGAVELDAPLAAYLPEAERIVYPTRDSPLITLRHLLTHTSGLPRLGKLDYHSDPNHMPVESDVLAAIDGVALESSPGTRTSYSNLGVAVASLVFARIAGSPYREFVQREVLAPMGLTSAAWDEADVPGQHLVRGYVREEGGWRDGASWRFGAAEGIGGLYLSFEDLARYAARQLDAWPARDEPQPLGPLRASLRESHLAAGHAVPSGQVFGLGWGTLVDADMGHLVFHTGSTLDYAANVLLAREHGVGVIAMTNTGDYDDLDALAMKALRALVAQLAPPSMASTPALSAAATVVVDLINVPDRTVIARHFSPRFLAQVSAEQLFALFQKVHGLGRCELGDRRDIASDFAGTFHIACDRGEVAADVTVSSDGIIGLSLKGGATP